MTEPAQRIKAELTALPPSDRAELAYYLLQSLGPAERDETDLDADLTRRAVDMRSGQVEGVPGDEVHRRLREKYS